MLPRRLVALAYGAAFGLSWLFLATGWSLYCSFGPRLKEARYLARHGDEFRRYQQAVSYWVPRRGGA